MDSISASILKLYSKRHYLSINQLGAVLNVDCFELSEPINTLKKCGYLRINANHSMLRDMDSDLLAFDTPLEITFEGKATLDVHNKLSKEKRNEAIRYAITTCIAVAAFIKSFFF